jgi:5-methylcytosine-specific restriction endonuclease McrA
MVLIDATHLTGPVRHPVERLRSSARHALVREMLLERNECAVCGGPLPQLASVGTDDPRAVSLDHVIPCVLGGTNDPANLRLTHRACNVVRDCSYGPLPARTIAHLRAWLAAYDTAGAVAAALDAMYDDPVPLAHLRAVRILRAHRIRSAHKTARRQLSNIVTPAASGLPHCGRLTSRSVPSGRDPNRRAA